MNSGPCCQDTKQRRADEAQATEELRLGRHSTVPHFVGHGDMLGQVLQQIHVSTGFLPFECGVMKMTRNGGNFSSFSASDLDLQSFLTQPGKVDEGLLSIGIQG